MPCSRISKYQFETSESLYQTHDLHRQSNVFLLLFLLEQVHQLGCPPLRPCRSQPIQTSEINLVISLGGLGQRTIVVEVIVSSTQRYDKPVVNDLFEAKQGE